MSAGPPVSAEVVSGPDRVGSELRWRVRTPDGAVAVVGQLLPELARDEAIRRRYVRDIERVQAVKAEGLARVIELGPQPDPRDPSAAPPWRVRLDPEGETLEAWLDRRAPAPIDEACGIFATIADVLFEIHRSGALFRDLTPRHVVLGEGAKIWLTDVGLSRVDILSTRTAASLVLAGSPYASPEQLARTTLDARSDLYVLGVMLFRALTGQLPFGDEPALLRPPGPPPPVTALRREVPTPIVELVGACLSEDLTARPESAGTVAAVLRGEATAPDRGDAWVACQNCGAGLRPGQRLCLNCGKVAVQFEYRSRKDEAPAVALVLTKVREGADQMARLRRSLQPLSEHRLPALNFLTGDARMYSKQERERLIRLPKPLFDNLTPATAERLRGQLTATGVEAKIKPMRGTKDTVPPQLAALVVGALTMLTVGSFVVGLPLALSGGLIIATAMAAFFLFFRARRHSAPVGDSLLRLRRAPAALPASDPIVAKLAALLTDSTPEDVRQLLGELALLVQRLVDHRAANLGEREQIAVVTEPVGELSNLIATEIRRIATIDAELAELDEGAMVRALAASEARREDRSSRTDILDGLDRLRTLEDDRARAFHRLLDASGLMRRSIELGLAVHDADAEHDRQVRLALAALSSD